MKDVPPNKIRKNCTFLMIDYYLCNSNDPGLYTFLFIRTHFIRTQGLATHTIKNTKAITQRL